MASPQGSSSLPPSRPHTHRQFGRRILAQMREAGDGCDDALQARTSEMRETLFVPLKVMPTSGGGAARPLDLGLSPTKLAALAYLFFLLLGGSSLFASSAATDTILPGEGISGNQTLVSKNGGFELGFFSPGEGIHYYLGVRLRNMFGNSPTFWLGDRVGVVVTDVPATSLEMFGGSLYIKQSGASLWWSPAGNGSSAAVAVLLDNGNLVVRDQGNSSMVLWQSFDCPGDAMLPGARLGLDRDTGKNVSLTFKGFSHNGTLSVDARRRNGSLPLSCESDGQTEHDDSFAPLDKLQGLPYNAQDEVARSDEDCRTACRSKCYCVAYSYDHGCRLWYYNLYNLSLAARPPYSKIYLRLGSKLRNKKGLQTRRIALLVAGLIGIASLVLILLLLWRFRRNSFASKKFEVEGPLVVYSYAQIKNATGNFSDKIGEGGFGSVFRGTMPGSAVIAVKNLKVLGQAEKQFRTEVQTLGVIQHSNLVRLLGFCVKANKRLLVYEYMPNGSLEVHLFKKKSSLLTWNARYQIALGIAKGLAYLHEECEDCIIHCDIKPENILLDAELCPKIADFGMAKLLGREFNSALTTVRGTMGYLAPEWISGLPITKKADVYSFGIVLFEIISGRRSTERMKFGNHRYFPLYAAAQVNEGEVLCLLDGRLEGEANLKELDVTCRVACWCIQDEENDRPSMGQVVRMLEGVISTEMPPIPASIQNLIEGDDSAIYSDF
ncbi:G-type lectin S-receptor-like serine/threonine-protein kinase At2g19130 [Lolium rigidum]|uniref:G-type lectin S-receptor-like serine/threonine-protein kinase At2g19130 n=1 Tax=Lolium rigidum TaxID=89674 RepID=UPI001F5C4D92|nr:G-type lectin S-receptor-like serine/threonine-protein kinase At2g19130 [Lolium rigidum]